MSDMSISVEMMNTLNNRLHELNRTLELVPEDEGLFRETEEWRTRQAVLVEIQLLLNRRVRIGQSMSELMGEPC